MIEWAERARSAALRPTKRRSAPPSGVHRRRELGGPLPELGPAQHLAHRDPDPARAGLPAAQVEAGAGPRPPPSYPPRSWSCGWHEWGGKPRKGNHNSKIAGKG